MNQQTMTYQGRTYNIELTIDHEEANKIPQFRDGMIRDGVRAYYHLSRIPGNAIMVVREYDDGTLQRIA